MNPNNNQTQPDHVERLLRQAEISRITRTLKSKLASASLETRRSPLKTPDRSNVRRRAKTLEDAFPSPVPFDTPVTTRKTRGHSRLPSATSVSSNSSHLSSSGSPYNMPRMPSFTNVNEMRSGSPHGNTILTPSQDLDHLDFFSQNRLKDISGHNGDVLDAQATLQQQSSTKPHSDFTEEQKLPKEPQTPPQIRAEIPTTPHRSSRSADNNDGANLLLHFATSPGRETPKTPDFNMGEYLNLQTPSPSRVQLTPKRIQWASLNSALFSQSPFRS